MNARSNLACMSLIAAVLVSGLLSGGVEARPAPGSAPQTYNGHYYLLTSAPVSWADAEAEAVGLGGHLVTIDDAAEQAWLTSTFNPAGEEVLWIGFTDAASEGIWTWVSGDAVAYTNWGGIEPNDHANEDHAAMQTLNTTNGCCGGPGRWLDIWPSGEGAQGSWPFGVGKYGIIEITTQTSGFCSGDGTAAACPCGNTGGAGAGCANSTGLGGRLAASGTPSVGADTLVLTATDAPPTATALYFQGDAPAAGGQGVPFGDGIRCVAGTVTRLGVRTSANGTSQIPAPGGPGIATQGAIPPAGGVRNYQVWYRNAQPFCIDSTFNLTNGLHVVWGP